MNDLAKLRLARQDIDHVIDIHDDAVERLHNQQRGQPGSSLGGGGGRGGGSPVESALGLSGPGGNGQIHGDKATRILDATERLIRNIYRDTRLLALALGQETPRAPSAKDQAEVARLNADPEDCEHHAKLDIFAPMKGKGPTDVAGNLPHPMRVCSSCYTHVYRYGVLPPADKLVREHHTGKASGERVST